MWLLPAIALAQAASTTELDATLKDLYAVISGGAGVKRDWEKFHGLFAEGAQMRALVKSGDKTRLVLLTPGDYVKRAGPMLEKDGFFETEVDRKTNTYGELVSVFSTYESRRDPKDEKPFDRGVNAVVLTRVEGKWKIVSLTWTNEAAAGKPPL